MSETRQFIIFMLCVTSLLVSIWTMIDVNHVAFAVDRLERAATEGQP